MSVCCECCVSREILSLCVIYKPEECGGPGPRWPVALEIKEINIC